MTFTITSPVSQEWACRHLCNHKHT